jgi:hypothetical protein
MCIFMEKSTSNIETHEGGASVADDRPFKD